jgi:hypothetical protein
MGNNTGYYDKSFWLNASVGTFANTWNSIRHFSERPLYCGIALSIMAVRVTAIIMFLVAWIHFITDGRYATTTELAVSGKWDEAFGYGTHNMYFNPRIFPVLVAAIGLTLLATQIMYIVEHSGKPKTIMIVCVSIITVVPIVAAIALSLFIKTVIPSAKTTLETIDAAFAVVPWLWENGSQELKIVETSALILFALAFAVAMIITYIAYGLLMRQWCSTILIVMAILPLLLWVVENIAILIITIIIAGVFVLFLFQLLSGETADSQDKPANSASNWSGRETAYDQDEWEYPENKRYRVWVKISCLDGGPHEGTYTVEARDADEAKQKAFDKLWNRLYDNLGIGYLSGNLVWDYYDVKEL